MNAAHKASWHFAPTGGGIIHGYNNAGTEHFKQDPIGKLVRETIQNSLDAHEDGLGAVGVDIQRCDIARENIGAESLKLHLQRALERLRETGQVEGQEDYRKALKIIGQPTISCLAIIDRNTTGLQGRKWDSLIYEEGTPEKDNVGVAGGSFGIGKNAPYNVAALHTVIYCTRYTNGKNGRVERMTGRTQMVSHLEPEGQDMLQHIGFYAAAGGQPLIGPDIPTPFRLSEPGTGLWIAGFMPGRTDWQLAAIRAAVSNCFHAIHHRKLEVRIGAETISYDTIDSIIESNLSNRTRQARNYYRAICGEPSGTTDPAGSIGALDVYIDNDASAPKRVAYVNRRGMLITDTRERRRSNPFYPGVGQGMWPNYAAVVIAKDDDTDRLVRRMENPSHDSISIDRLSDEERRAIRPHLANASEQIREIIANAIREHEEAGTTNLQELAELFPDLDPTMPGNQDLEARTITPTLPRHHVVAIDDPEDGEEPILDDNGIDVDGVGSNDGRPDNGNGRKRSGKARPDPGSGKGNRNAGGQTATINKARIVRANPTELTLAFTMQQKDKDACAFTIRPAGDEYRREKRIPINSVRVVSPQGASAELDGSLVRIKGNVEDQPITLALDIGADAPYLADTISEHRESD